MKKNRGLSKLAAMLGVVAMLVVTAAIAQEQQSTSQQASGTTGQSAQKASAGTSQDRDRGTTIVGATATDVFHPIRASKLIGMDVKNSSGEDLGEVEDVVMDTHGNVRCLALSFGGFLDIGDKLIAVPWSAMAIKSDREDRSDQHLVLNVDKNVLEKAPGFDEDNWPSATTSSFWMAVDKHYGTERRAYRGETGQQPQGQNKDTASTSSSGAQDR